MFFSIRKDRPREEQINQYGLREFLKQNDFPVIADLDKNILSKIDLVVGTYSSFIYEMIEIGKPVGILKSSTSKAGVLVSEGLAEWIDIDANNICDQINKISNTPVGVLKERASFFKTRQNFDDFLEGILGTISS
jgi:hypothetical protein